MTPEVQQLAAYLEAQTRAAYDAGAKDTSDKFLRLANHYNPYTENFVIAREVFEAALTTTTLQDTEGQQ
jgi:hypothetical protein